jgi:4-amino-4-deoxy-L-arabinose transferase-like glycosyltransferase
MEPSSEGHEPMTTLAAGDGGGSVSETGPRGSQLPPARLRARAAIATGLTALAVLSALVLRWFHLGQVSLWWDEGFTAWAASLSPGDILRFARSDNQPPLYYLLQHYWGTLFGNSEYALRALSAFVGTLSLPVFYLLAKKVLSDSMAVVLATWLFAFSMKQVWYSREARTYELASFLALVALYALVLFLERRSAASFATIVLAATASLYSHNMMFFYLLALNVTWLIYPSERSWAERAKELLLADVLAGVLYLPWALNLFTQVGAVGENLWWVPRPTVRTLGSTLRELAGFETEYLSLLPSRLLPLSPHAARVCVAGGTLLLSIAMVGGGLWRVPKADRRRNVSLLLYCLLPILVVFVLSQKMPLYIDRVFTTSSVVVPLIFAYPLALERGRNGRVLYAFLGIIVAGTTALSAFGFLRYQETKAKSNEDWRGTTAGLLSIPERNRLLVFVPPAGEMLFDYYARRFRSIDPDSAKIGLPGSFHEQFPPPKARLIGPPDVNRLKIAVESKKYSEVDLVLTHDVDPHGLVFDYLSRVFVRHEEQEQKLDGNSVRVTRFLALAQ